MRIFRQKQAGASLLEFLVTIPVLVLLAYMAIEFGGFFTRLNTMSKSVQDASRYLSDVSVNKSNTAAQETIAANLVLYGSVAAGTPILPGTINTPVISHPDANHVRVEVVYNHTPIAGQALSNLLQLIGGGSVNFAMQIPVSSTMRYAQ